jgi:thiosulfate/3-mercaptopyruvate sulfurtransferase
VTRDPDPSTGSPDPSVLVTARDLMADVAQLPVPVIFDVRWQLGDPDGRVHYFGGHIPGAQYLDLTSELSAVPSQGTGRHPLPDPEAFQAAMRKAGLNDADRVVIYDDVGSTSAARAWWLLRWAGKQNVRLLDGGLKAWIAEGGELAVGPGNPVERGDFTFDLDHMRTVTLEEAADWPDRGVLLDVRAAERYEGRSEPVDKRAGHIPGARNLPTTSFLDERGRFLPAERIRELFAEVGVTQGNDTAVYCGSGIHAAHALAAMEIAGLEAGRLYPGSWSQWSSDRRRPVALGEEPGR